MDCVLPKNDCSTTISKYEALVILAIKGNLKIEVSHMILTHMWRTQGNKPDGSLLLRLFRYKEINMPKNLG